jgi:hypothetical protein
MFCCACAGSGAARAANSSAARSNLVMNASPGRDPYHLIMTTNVRPAKRP